MRINGLRRKVLIKRGLEKVFKEGMPQRVEFENKGVSYPFSNSDQCFRTMSMACPST